MILFLTLILFQQVQVEVKGVGPDRTSAIQNGLREAVAQALGTIITSEAQVQNFQLIKDVIKAKAEGYVSSYEIIEETPFPDRYEVKLRAIVTRSPLEIDTRSLAQWLGGLRFMTIYDPRKLKTRQDTIIYNYAYERMNEYLARQGYRYVEKDVFERLKGEAIRLVGADTSTIDYAKKLAFLADAEFFICISNINITKEQMAMDVVAIKVTADTKSYDNCTGEGLGTAVGEGDFELSKNEDEAIRKAIDGAIYNAGEKNLPLILRYLGEWCNNGAPFELRFYGIDEDRMDELVDKLRSDPDFGSQLEPVITSNYWRLNTTFKKPPYDMRRKIRDYARELQMPLETKLQYGRQISFAPRNINVPEAEEKSRAEQIIRRK
jgi:hypothetical protein